MTSAFTLTEQLKFFSWTDQWTLPEKGKEKEVAQNIEPALSQFFRRMQQERRPVLFREGNETFALIVDTTSCFLNLSW